LKDHLVQSLAQARVLEELAVEEVVLLAVP
jgi:hypothetical protein